MWNWKSIICVGALGIAGCTNAPGGNDSGTSDANVSMPQDAATSDAAALSCQARVPTDNFCTREFCNFSDFSLQRCDSRGNYNFYNEDFCQARLTLLVIAAGWCVPCQQEAPMIEESITKGYNGQVRVITVIYQNPDRTPPTINFCNTWRTQFGAPLTSHMVIDPLGVTQRYFPSMAFPSNMIVDNKGRIRYIVFGTRSGLGDIRQQIDALLAEAP